MSLVGFSRILRHSLKPKFGETRLRMRVLGGSRRPQLVRLTEGRLKRGSQDPTFELNVYTFYSGNGNLILAPNECIFIFFTAFSVCLGR